MDNEIEIELHVRATQYATSWPVHLHKVAYDSFIAGHSRITELLNKERLKVLDECIEVIQKDGDILTKQYALENLESLKGKLQ